MKTIAKTLLYLQMAAFLLTTALGHGLGVKGIPFHGSLSGHYTSAPGVDPATFSASGKASKIGRFTFSFEGRVTPDATSAFGTMQFIAANGDKIFADFTGVALVALPIISIEEDLTITGGTGRFEGVTGEVTMKRTVAVTTGFSEGSFEGLLWQTKQVPFRGFLQGDETSQLEFPRFIVDGCGRGKVTQLGRMTATWHREGSLIDGSQTASYEFRTAKGDFLFAESIGQARITPEGFSVSEAATITGGTGRFTGATGSFSIERVVVGTGENTSTTSHVIDGALVLRKGRK